MSHHPDYSRRTLLAGAAAALATAVLQACAPVPVQKTTDTGPPVFPKPPDAPRFIYERTIYSSADVVPDTGNAELKRLLTGAARRGEVLNKPSAIAVHQGRIYVSDTVESVIRVFDIPGGRHYRIGAEDPGLLSKPLGLDVDRNGNVYVADTTAKAIMIYDRDGKFLRKIGNAKWFDRLANVTVDPKGDRLYLVDIGGVSSQQHRVRVVSAITGEHMFDFGKRGKEAGEFNFPRDIAVNHNGLLYIVDSGNFRVQIFDRDGKFLKSFGSIGRQFGQFARPKEIAVDAEGNVYVVDTAFGNFQIFDREGELLMFVGTRSEQDGPARYMLPAGIAVDEDGRVYMVDQWFRKVDIYRPYAMKADAGWLGKRTGTKTVAR